MLAKPVVEIAPRTWLISEYKLVNMYLLEGDEAALLIDCGTGIGNAAETVRELTDKPLTVAITHGHFDHDGAAALFPEIHLHPMDIKLSEVGYARGEEARAWYAKSRGPVRNPEATEEELLALVQKNGPVRRIPMEGGTVFELGGRTIEVIHTPGHSLGSVCLLDRENRLLFTGDMCNDSLLLNCGDSSSTVKVYNESMRRLWAREKEFDFICLGHDALDKADKTMITDYIEATDLLLSGQAHGEKGRNALHGGTGYKYKRVLIWYEPERLV